MTEEQQGNRQKKYYTATSHGKEFFLQWLSAPLDSKSYAEAHLAKIFFYGELPQEIRTKRLQEFEFLVEQLFNQLHTLRNSINIDNLNDSDYYKISTLFFGLKSTQNTLNWLNHIKQQKPFSQFMEENL